MRKLNINPITGCAHVRNDYGYKVFRVCSACDAIVPEISGINEDEIDYCWHCGAMFDHTEDDEVQEE